MMQKILAVLLMAGLATAMMNPDEWATLNKKGLEKVATGAIKTSLMPPKDAEMLLKSWYGVTRVCSEANEAKWQAYCQNMYYENTAIDCNAVSPEDKAMIMSNMRVCRAI